MPCGGAGAGSIPLPGSVLRLQPGGVLSLTPGGAPHGGKVRAQENVQRQVCFNLLASNGQVISTSETYDSRASALQGIESVKKHAPDDARFGA